MNKERDIIPDKKRFLYAAIVFAALAVIFYIYNGFIGLKLEKVGTFDNCELTIGYHTNPEQIHGEPIPYLTLTVIQTKDIDEKMLQRFAESKGEETIPYNSDGSVVLFKQNVADKLYDEFAGFNDTRVTFYRDDKGWIFPVAKTDCSLSEAKREYRMHNRMKPRRSPSLWMLFFAGVSMVMYWLFSKIKSDKSVMQGVYDPKVGFDTPEDALGAMAAIGVRREKQNAQARKLDLAYQTAVKRARGHHDPHRSIKYGLGGYAGMSWDEIEEQQDKDDEIL